MKNFLLFNQSFGTVGSPNQTGETQTRENRIGLMSYLRRTLMLLFAVLMLSIANIATAWGTNQTYTIDNPTQDYHSSSPITIIGEYQTSKKVDNVAKAYTNQNRATYIYSNAANIKVVTFRATSSSTGSSGTTNCANVKVLGSSAFVTPSVGDFTATTDGASLASLSSIAITKVQSSHTEISVTFTNPVSAVEISQVSSSAGGYSYVGKISVTYDDAITSPSLFSEGHFTGTTTGTATNSCSWGSFTLNSTTAVVSTKSYYKRNDGNAITYNLATGTTLSAGDVIVLDICGASSSNGGSPGAKSVSITLTNGLTWAFKSTASSAHDVTFVIPTGNALIGEDDFSFVINNTDTRVYGVRVYHAAAGCPYYSFHTGGDDVQTNNTQSCFVNYTSTEEWQLRDYTIPADTKFFVGNRGYWYNSDLGNNHSKSVAKTWAEEMYLARSFDSGDAGGSPKLGQATGATGTIRIYDNSNWNNLNAAFIPDGYVLKVGSNEHAFAFLSSNEYRTDIVEINSTTYDDAISVGVKNSSNGYVATANSQELRHIFFVPSPQWKSSNAKFCIHYWGAGDSRIGFMSEVPGKSGWYEGWLPSGATGFQFERQNPAGSVPSSDNRWTAGDNQTLQDGKNCYTMTATGESWDGTITTSLYSASGKYRIWDNSKSINWYVTFVPHYVLKYDANGGSNAPAQQSIETTASPCQLTVAAGSGMTAPTGYQFLGWNPNESQADAGTKDGNYDPGDTPTMSDDVTLYAVWSAKSCTVSFDNNGGTGGTNTVTATYDAEMPSKASNLPTKAGYDFAGYYDSETNDDGTGTKYYNADGSSARNWDKNTTSATTLYAKWNCITPDAPAAGKITATDGCSTGATFSADIAGLPSYVTWYWQTAADGTSTEYPASSNYTTNATAGSKTIYLRAKNTVCDTWSASGSTPSKSAKVKTAATVSWSAHPTAATVGDGGKTFSVTTNYAEGLEWALESNTCDATLIGSGTSRTLSYTSVGSVTVKATVTGAGDYCSSAVVSETVTVTAAAAYTVTYNKNGDGAGGAGSVTGTVPTDATSYSSGERAVVKEPGDLAWEGHTFIGWNTEANGSGTYYSPQANFAITASTTLYAQWRTASSCPGGEGGTVYSLSMGDNSKGSSKALTYGESVQLSTLSYATITNGNASFTDIRTATGDTKATITKANPALIQFGGAAAMLAIYLDCALQDGDQITFTGGNQEICFTASPTRDEAIATSSKSLTISTASHSALIGKKIIYIWRKGSTTFGISALTITRPASCTDVSITTEPTTPVAATVGSACSITGLVAAGTSPTYRWYTCNSDGSSATAINAPGTLSFTGYTTATLGLTPTATGATYYKCVVSGSCGDPVTSSVVTVNATAAPTLYTVTFNSNGGSSVDAIEQASAGASITMPAAPTYASHTFQGWVIGGTTKAAGDSYTPAANVTAYATWKANCAGGGSGSTEVYNGENVAKGNTTASGWTINNSSNMTLTSGSSDGYSYWYLASSSTNYVQFDGSASLVAGDKIKIQWTHTVANKDLTLTINGSGASLTSGGHVTTANTKMEAVYDVTSAKTVTSIKLNSSGSGGCKIYQVTIVKASGGGCCYVTYNGNGAESGCISDKTAYTAGEGDVTILGNTGVSAYVKLGYRFNGWNTAANGSGKAYAAGDVVENISNDLTLHAQWVLDACSAPAAPTISGTASRTVGQNIELTATCASGADGSTTYTWYKGVDWATASAASPVQDAMTAGAGGRTFTKASCVAGDAGTYWCKASNGTGCEAHNETGFTVTVSDAVGDEHIYYYKDANHYSDGTYSDPEGNTASSGDNKSLSSPWTICRGCKAGVDSVVAYGATYDGKGNHMNAYIKLPTGGNATTKNITFALTAGYTGTLTMKIGGYENNPTVTLQPLVAGVLGDAIAYSGTVGGVATTEDNFGEITWDLSTAGGTYVLTVTSKTGYISQIDMTTETSAKFNVTYNGNGKTGGDVPTDDTDYEANESVTVQAQGTMVKANYTFGGWNTANNGTGTNYVAGSGTFSIKGATTLYAHWTQTINLAPGAKGTGSLGATVSWNGTAVRGFTAHTAAGYSLTGYYTETSGGTKVLNADGSFAATNVTDYITDGKWSRTGAAATLYAQWSGSAIVTNTLGVGSSSKWKSTISTTAPLQITSLSALAAVGGLVIEDANGTSASDRALTCKVEASGATSKTDGEYLQLSFSIAAGYKLRVTGLDVTVRSVGKAGKYHLELVGTTGSLIPDDEQVASGAVNTIFDDAYNVELTGDVTLKLWAYGKDGSNPMEYYRLGSPIAIYGAVEETCTPPTFSGLDYSATEYTQGATASAISVTGAANEESYQWKQNTVNDRTGAGVENAVGTGANTASFIPSTASTGTLYYWCELENTCTTVKTPTVAVTVSASASNPTVTWSSVKLNGEAATVNYGGGKYELRATVDQSTWSGTLESSMITAPAGIYIHNIGIGTEDSKQYIEFQFDVTTAFDREENETIGFHLSLPAISGTPNWNALTSDKLVTYEACDEGEGAAGQVAIPLTATAQTSATNPQNYWEVAEAGWLAFNYGSAVSVLPAATAYRTSEVDFGYYVATTNKKKWMFQPYIAGVNKVRVAFRAAGNLSSGQASVSKFYYDTEYFASPGSHENLIGDVSASQATYTSGENGYIEFTVPEMAANSYGAFELANSSIEIYGIVLYSENTGSGGSVETDPTWSGGLNKDGSSEVDKNQGDPNFTYTISTTTNTLGGITYSSSNPSVAEVNATTGEVRITATGNAEQTAVITATLARSGCYQPATRTYTVRVAGQECTITSAGTLTADKTSKCESDNVVLSLSGHDTDGTTVTWYRDETDVTSSVSNNTLTTSTPGAYSVVVSKSGCSLRSNTVNVTNISAATSATKIVDRWYVKNGRLTPDIALWRLDEGTTFTGVSWSPSNSTGLDFVIRDGIVYLEGKEPNVNSSSDIEYTLTLTITDACRTPHELTDKTITLIHQKNTDKHVLAFVVTGKEKGGFTESIPAAQTDKVALYNEIAKNFDVQATNIYSTDDEQKIKEYYSQFDIICITDYPNTKTKGTHSVSYSDAIGVMVDIRPVLTMEAWVSGLANWNKKGISGDPKSPSTRQYTMLLQCKDHEIFAGTKLTEVGEGDDKMYRIHMVDETQHPYDTLDANYGSGTHKSKEGYRYGSYPALQGFTFSQAMEDADLLPLGLIDDGAGNDLQVGLERQHEMSARMMVLGINSTAMERLTADGERIVINALKYLMKKSAEEIADCSTSFVGGAEGDETNWMNAVNWTGNTVPDKTQKVRILAPCTVPEGEKAHVAGVLIAPNDGGTYNGGSTPTTGSLTIAAGGALVVDGKIQSVTAPAYNRPRATAPADLAVLTSVDAQGALIFDNSEGETQATVQMYSKASGAPNDCKWQWIATPFSNVNRAIEFYYGAWMYEWDNATHGWTQILNDDPMEPFKGYSITQEAAGSYWMNGVLASTESREQTLRSDEIGGKNNGINVIGNSWTAPIQIANFEAEDFTNAHATIFILNTGLDANGTGAVGTNNSTAGQYISIPVEASALMESTLKVIPAMQAFQVKAHVGGGSLNMDYDRLVRKGAMSQEQIDEPMRAPGRQIRRAPRVNKAEVEKMHITIRGSRFQDEVYIFAHPDFTEGFDNGWDGEKIRGASEAVQLFVRDATSRWAVAAVPTFVGTYLATYKGEDNEYTISFDYSGDETLYWYDTKTDIYTEINAENTYTYTTDVSTIQTRFMITNENPKLEVPTGVESEKTTNTKAVKFIDEDKMYIFVNGKLYDATGKVVK